MGNERWMQVFYKFCIGLIFGILFGVAYLLIQYRFDIIAFCDCFFLTAFFVFVIGLCSFVNNEGFFDMITYGFQLVPYIFQIQKVKKYEDLIAYKEAKNIKRIDNKLAPIGYLFAAVLFLIIGLILYLIIKF